MSRTIKFRAWGKTEKEYIRYPFAWLSLFDSPDGLEIEENEDLVIEQYIGLKDKNDKEIYEGDIVKFADLELAMKPAGVVCFSDGKFFVKDWEFDDGSYHIVDFYDYNIPYRDFEVIGNIHENPELLEDK